MSKNKFLKFMATERGRTRTFQGACFIGISIFAAEYVPQTFLISQMQNLMQAYRNGVERDVSETMKRRFEIAMDKCECTSFERRFLKLFVIVGFDVYQLGSLKSKYAGLIGIPTNYFYNSTKDIDRPDIQLRSEEIDWSSVDGKRLQDALVLTEDEQIFGLARSVLLLKTNHLLLRSIYGPATLLAMYGMGSYINDKQRLFTRPLGLRLCLYSILGLFGYGVYSFLTDFTQVYYDTSVDEELASMGPEFIKSGVGFYTKMLQKNIAIRNMLGGKEYTASGNEDYFIRQKGKPITQRKAFFQQKLDELENKLKEVEISTEATTNQSTV